MTKNVYLCQNDRGYAKSRKTQSKSYIQGAERLFIYIKIFNVKSQLIVKLTF